MADVNQSVISIEKIVLGIGLLELPLSLAEARQLQEALNDLFSAPRQPCLLGLPIYYGTWAGTPVYPFDSNTSGTAAPAHQLEVT